MNVILLTAILGFICHQWYVVDRAVRPIPGVHFNLMYYLRDNWFALIGNLLGTALMFCAAPALMVFLRLAARSWVDNDALVEALTDQVLAPVVGGIIGLVGSVIVGMVQDKVREVFGLARPDSLPTSDTE